MEVEVKPQVYIVQLLLIYGLAALSYVTMIFGPRRLGFFCGDESIRFPYKDNTIPIAVIHTFFFVGVISMIVAVEHYCSRHLYSKYCSKIPNSYRLGALSVPPVIVRIIKFFLISQLGYVVDTFLLNITKYSVGRLRPHFLAVCRPTVNTTTIAACGDAATYIQHYMCLGKDEAKITDARLSFFSGHTSHSFFIAVFFSLYLHARVGRTCRTSVAFPVLYTLLFACAAVVGYSRIADHKHHVGDVVTGALEGSITAVIMVLLFRHQFFDVIFDPYEQGAAGEEGSSSSSSGDSTPGEFSKTNFGAAAPDATAAEVTSETGTCTASQTTVDEGIETSPPPEGDKSVVVPMDEHDTAPHRRRKLEVTGPRILKNVSHV